MPKTVYFGNVEIKHYNSFRKRAKAFVPFNTHTHIYTSFAEGYCIIQQKLENQVNANVIANFMQFYHENNFLANENV